MWIYNHLFRHKLGKCAHREYSRCLTELFFDKSFLSLGLCQDVYCVCNQEKWTCWMLNWTLACQRRAVCHLYLCTCSIPAVVHILDLGRRDTQAIEEVAIFKELLRTSVGVGGTLWNPAFELIVLRPHFKRSSVSEGFN